MLIILGGLPGTGKTTLAKNLAKKIKATYLRIDTIEHVLITKHNNSKGIEDLGYLVSYAVATENLKLGNTVIADSVNPLSITRNAWLNAAKEAGTSYLEIEIICSNKKIHQQRVENRASDLAGFKLPSWQAVCERFYEPWQFTDLIIDTATTTIEESTNQLYQLIEQKSL